MFSGKAAAILGVGALAAIGIGAASASASASPGEDPWDKGIPEDVKNDVKRLLANETNPANLRAYASQLRAIGYPKAAAMLDKQAANLEAGKPPLSATVPDLGNVPLKLREQLSTRYLSEKDPAALRALSASLSYTGFPVAGKAFEARASELEKAQGKPPGANPPIPQQWDASVDATQRQAWATGLTQMMTASECGAYANFLQQNGYPVAAQTFGSRALVLQAAEGTPAPLVQPGTPPAPPAPPVIVSPPSPPQTTPPFQFPGLPGGLPSLPGGLPTIPGFPGNTAPPTAPPVPAPPVPAPPVPGFPGGLPVPGFPGGLPVPGFPGTTPTTPPAPPVPAPPVPAPPVPAPPLPGGLPIPGFPGGLPVPGFPGTTPTAPPVPPPVPPHPPAEKPQPSAYGLPAGAWINDARQVAYVVQPGDYGAKIAGKFGNSDVPGLVKANPQIKDWTKVMAGVDVNIPPTWRPVKANEWPTLRPGPAAPGNQPVPVAPPPGLPAPPGGWVPGQNPPPAPPIPAVIPVPPPGTPGSSPPWIGPTPPAAIAPPAPQQKPQPSAYGLPAGAWINDARQVAYVVQPGDYGAKIAGKFKQTDVKALVKANPQIKDWTKVMAGVDVNIPPTWRAVGPAEFPTLRPGPSAPSK